MYLRLVDSTFVAGPKFVMCQPPVDGPNWHAVALAAVDSVANCVDYFVAMIMHSMIVVKTEANCYDSIVCFVPFLWHLSAPVAHVRQYFASIVFYCSYLWAVYCLNCPMYHHRRQYSWPRFAFDRMHLMYSSYYCRHSCRCSFGFS